MASENPIFSIWEKAITVFKSKLANITSALCFPIILRCNFQALKFFRLETRIAHGLQIQVTCSSLSLPPGLTAGKPQNCSQEFWAASRRWWRAETHFHAVQPQPSQCPKDSICHVSFSHFPQEWRRRRGGRRGGSGHSRVPSPAAHRTWQSRRHSQPAAAILAPPPPARKEKRGRGPHLLPRRGCSARTSFPAGAAPTSGQRSAVRRRSWSSHGAAGAVRAPARLPSPVPPPPSAASRQHRRSSGSPSAASRRRRPPVPSGLPVLFSRNPFKKTEPKQNQLHESSFSTFSPLLKIFQKGIQTR